MEAVGSSETSVNFYQTTAQRHTPEDRTLHLGICLETEGNQGNLCRDDEASGQQSGRQKNAEVQHVGDIIHRL
jgi:hypothetical protein